MKTLSLVLAVGLLAFAAPLDLATEARAEVCEPDLDPGQVVRCGRQYAACVVAMALGGFCPMGAILA